MGMKRVLLARGRGEATVCDDVAAPGVQLQGVFDSEGEFHFRFPKA
jgi:hypothetical protein